MWCRPPSLSWSSHSSLVSSCRPALRYKPLEVETWTLTSLPGISELLSNLSPPFPLPAMVYKTFLLGLVTLLLPHLVSSLIVPTRSIHNCSGEADPAPTTYKPYFSSYGPQLTGGNGWEEWTFVLPDFLNQSMFHFRWTRGDPAARNSNPRTATFSLLYEKTGFRASVKDSFKADTVGDSSLSISIGKNTLSFDGTKGPFGLWSISADIEGLKANVIVDP